MLTVLYENPPIHLIFTSCRLQDEFYRLLSCFQISYNANQTMDSIIYKSIKNAKCDVIHFASYVFSFLFFLPRTSVPLFHKHSGYHLSTSLFLRVHSSFSIFSLIFPHRPHYLQFLFVVSFPLLNLAIIFLLFPFSSFGYQSH